MRAAGFRIVSSGRRGGELLGDANRCAKLAVARSRSSDGSDQACCARGAAQRDQALARRAEIAQAVSVTGVETSGCAGPAAANETLVSLLDKSPPVVRDALLRPPKRESDSPAGQEECSICYIFFVAIATIFLARPIRSNLLLTQARFSGAHEKLLEKPRDDIEFGAFININLDRAMRRLRAVFRAEALHEEGLSVQEWRALLNLARFGDCHLRELARLAGLDATHTGRAALELERKGLIRRSDDERDSRRKRLCVTKVGHEVVDRVWAKALRLDARVRSRLGKTRYNAVKEALVILLELPAEDEAMQGVQAAELG